MVIFLDWFPTRKLMNFNLVCLLGHFFICFFFFFCGGGGFCFCWFCCCFCVRVCVCFFFVVVCFLLNYFACFILQMKNIYVNYVPTFYANEWKHIYKTICWKVRILIFNQNILCTLTIRILLGTSGGVTVSKLD